MAIASGWRREDAVVSEATQRLVSWMENGPWRAQELEEGAPPLALALASLLDARGVLLLVQGESGAWQPAAWARGIGRRFFATPIPVDEDGLDAGLGVFATSLEATRSLPLMREEWNQAQASLASRSALLAGSIELHSASADAPII